MHRFIKYSTKLHYSTKVSHMTTSTRAIKLLVTYLHPWIVDPK